MGSGLDMCPKASRSAIATECAVDTEEVSIVRASLQSAARLSLRSSSTCRRKLSFNFEHRVCLRSFSSNAAWKSQ